MMVMVCCWWKKGKLFLKGKERRDQNIQKNKGVNLKKTIKQFLDNLNYICTCHILFELLHFFSQSIVTRKNSNKVKYLSIYYYGKLWFYLIHVFVVISPLCIINCIIIWIILDKE